MPGLASTFQTASTQIIGGKPVAFARLELERDLSVLAAAITARRKEQARRLFDEANAKLTDRLKMSAGELFSIFQAIEDREPQVGDLYAFAKTPAGVAAVLNRSLEAAGMTDPAARAAVLRALDANTATLLSASLVTCQPVEEEKDNGPLPGTPASSGTPEPPAPTPSDAAPSPSVPPVPAKVGTATVPAGYAG